MASLALLISIFTSLAHSFPIRFSPGPPIILVPGDGGSQIQAKINRTKTVHYICKKVTADYFDLWLNLEELAPIAIDCFVDNMKMTYNLTTRRSENNEGVLTRVPGWGNTSSVEYLDPSQNRVGIYFAALVEAAVSWGYTRGKDIRGAPFDFRKSPNDIPEFFPRLKALIEETYYANGNRRVVTIGHSMGNPFLLYFFNQQKQSWKDKFIRTFVSVAAPWAGSAKIMKLLATGYNMDHWRILLPPSSLRPEQRSMTSSPFLMPNSMYWGPDENLVETPTKNYTTANYEEFYTDIGFPVGWEMYKDSRGTIQNLTAPGVEVHCLYSVGLPTPLRFQYAAGYFPDYPPTVVTGDGDGTVNVRSARACTRWRTQQPQAVLTGQFRDQEHLDILQDKDLIQYVKGVLMVSS